MFKKLKPIGDSHKGCLMCGPLLGVLDLSRELSVGFGDTTLTKDGVIVYEEPREGPYMTGSEAEALAALDPDHDWRIIFNAPLYDATYQRQDNKWVLVERGLGFA